MLQEIINKFCVNSKFINNFDGVVSFLDKTNLSYKEKSVLLEEVFEYNSKMYSLIVEENKELEKVVTRLSSTNERKEIPIIEEKNVKKDVIKPLEFDVKPFVVRIKNCNNLDEIKDIISNKNSINVKIILELVEEIYEIKKMLYQERFDIDNKTKLFFENELEKLKIKVEYIKQIITKSKTEIKEIKSDGNKMIFLKTNYGNVCAYSDIKDIPVDYYDTFRNLLESIEDGTFKNLKILSGVGPLKGLSEVKDDQARIVFDNIGKDNFVIIAMFIKKVDTDAAYRAYLINRKSLYENNESNITEFISSSKEFLEENKIIRDKIYSILNKEIKTKKKGVVNG